MTLTIGINIAIFSLIALLHLVRLLFQWPVQFAGWNVPLWLNVVFVIMAGVLIYLNAKYWIQ